MKEIKMKALECKLVPIEKITANNWNPNKVAKPEMDLLQKSIEDNGFCFPIATIYDKEKDEYVIIDGYHRYLVSKTRLGLKEVPIVVLDYDIKMQMSATIQFNRARGTHQLEPMKAIIRKLFDEGKTTKEICKQLGMRPEEVFRLSDFGREEFLKLMINNDRTENVNISGYSNAYTVKKI